MTASHCHSYCQLSPSLFFVLETVIPICLCHSRKYVFLPIYKEREAASIYLAFLSLIKNSCPNHALVPLALVDKQPGSHVPTLIKLFWKTYLKLWAKRGFNKLRFFWWKKVSYLFKISKSTLSRIFFLFSIFTLKPNFIISLKVTWIGEKKSSGLTFYFPLRWYNFGSKGFPREDLKTKHKGFLFFQLLIKISVGVFHLLMFIKTPFFLLFPLSSFWAK